MMPEVKIDQVWQDNDARGGNRRVKVVCVEEERKRVGVRNVASNRLSYLAVHRLRTSYTLISEKCSVCGFVHVFAEAR